MPVGPDRPLIVEPHDLDLADRESRLRSFGRVGARERELSDSARYNRPSLPFAVFVRLGCLAGAKAFFSLTHIFDVLMRFSRAGGILSVMNFGGVSGGGVSPVSPLDIAVVRKIYPRYQYFVLPTI